MSGLMSAKSGLLPASKVSRTALAFLTSWKRRRQSCHLKVGRIAIIRTKDSDVQHSRLCTYVHVLYLLSDSYPGAAIASFRSVPIFLTVCFSGNSVVLKTKESLWFPFASLLDPKSLFPEADTSTGAAREASQDIIVF